MSGSPESSDLLLGSELSWRIIDSLLGHEAGEEELRKKLGAPAGKLSESLDQLVAARLVTRRVSSSEEGEETVYALSGTKGKDVFPPRDYLMLGETLFRGIARSLGPESARLVLHDIGLRAGEDLAQDLLLKSGKVRVDPDAFVEYIVRGVMSQSGTYPRLIRKTKDEVEFEQFNCPFQELADRYPGLMCDAVDEGLHEGIDRKLSVKTERVLCKGHRDPTCRFVVRWENRGAETATSSYRSNKGGRPGRRASGSTSRHAPGPG